MRIRSNAWSQGRFLTPAAYYAKLRTAPRTSAYCWTLSGNGGALDPTDATGNLCEPLPFLESVPALARAGLYVETTLALINEPSPGLDINVRTKEVGQDVYFITDRDVACGEECVQGT